MALFRSNKPVVFDPYGSRRRSGPLVPRWLMILLAGIAIGAGGLYYVQQNYLPERLTPAESRALLARANALETETKRLQAALDKTTAEAKAASLEATRRFDAAAAEAARRFDAAAAEAAREIGAARAEITKLTAERDAARASIARTRKDIALFEQVLPPDPRGGTIGVRAARLSNDAGKLNFHILLTRERTGKVFEGVVELVVTGRRASGRTDTVTLDPVDVSMDGYDHVQGSLALPEGFVARQATIRVLERAGGRMLGMRVLNVS